MPKSFNLYVPAEYTFRSYFLPRIKNPALESFEVGRHRHGIQRKGNNHLVVFLDFCLQDPTSKFTAEGSGAGDFRMKTPASADLFKRTFGHEKEVAVFSLVYHARMSVVAWKLLADIADDDRILVEDDTGHLMRGSDYVREHERLMGKA